MNRRERRAQQRQAKGYTVPSGPPPGEARDERMVYGAGCTWQGTIYQIRTVRLAGHDMPCCPYCGGMLYQVESAQVWDEAVQRYAEATNDPGYPGFIEWNRNRRCLSLHPEQGGATAFERLRAQYEAERAEGLS